MIGAMWAILAAAGAGAGETMTDDMTPRLAEPSGPGRVFLQHYDSPPLPKPKSQKKRRRLARRGRR